MFRTAVKGCTSDSQSGCSVEVLGEACTERVIRGVIERVGERVSG